MHAEFRIFLNSLISQKLAEGSSPFLYSTSKSAIRYWNFRNYSPIDWISVQNKDIVPNDPIHSSDNETFSEFENYSKTVRNNFTILNVQKTTKDRKWYKN